MATRKPIVNVAGTLRELPAGDGVAVGDVVGLGTAAAANLTTSKVDTTAGRVLKVGDFGLGEYTPSLTKSQENTLLNGRSTFYSAQDESDLLTYSGGLQIGYTYPGYATQIASSMGNSVPILKVRVLNNNVWGQPVTLLHTNNLAQGVGGSTEYPMSQAATTTALNSLQPGPWIDLRPYLNPALIYEPARAGKNNFDEVLVYAAIIAALLFARVWKKFAGRRKQKTA